MAPVPSQERRELPRPLGKASYLVGLVVAAAIFAVGLLIGLSRDREESSPRDDTGVATVTVANTATLTETAASAFSLESGQFVELIQICAAIRNGRLPRLDNPIATPPAMTQEVLDNTIANCRPRQR